MPRRKNTSKFEREWFRAVREGRVQHVPDAGQLARLERYGDMFERGEPLRGQEAIAEYWNVSVETVRRWWNSSAEIRRWIRKDDSGHFKADVGEMLNLIPHVYELRTLGQRRRRLIRRQSGVFATGRAPRTKPNGGGNQ